MEVADEREREVIVGVRVDNNRNEEDGKMLKELVDRMENELNEATRGLKKVDRRKVRQWTRKVNEVMNVTQTETITDTNKVIRAASVYVARKVGLRTGKGSRKDKQEPWWKRRIKGSIDELRRHINILERNRRGELRKRNTMNQSGNIRLQQKERQ